MCALTVCFSLEAVDVTNHANAGFMSILSKVVGNSSWVREVAMSARAFDASEALQVGFVSRVLPSNEEAATQTFDLAERVGSKSLAYIQMTKLLLNHKVGIPGGKHSVSDYIRLDGNDEIDRQPIRTWTSNYSEIQLTKDLDQALGVGSIKSASKL